MTTHDLHCFASVRVNTVKGARGMWGVAFADGSETIVKTGLVPATDNNKTTQAEALLAAFAALFDLVGSVHTFVAVSPFSVRGSVYSVLAQYPAVDLATGMAAELCKDADEALLAAMEELTKEAAAEYATKQVGCLTINTDASLGFKRSLAGAGWVGHIDGEPVFCGQKVVQVSAGKSTSAELSAIHRGLQEALAFGSREGLKIKAFRIETDSLNAVNMLNNVMGKVSAVADLEAGFGELVSRSSKYEKPADNDVATVRNIAHIALRHKVEFAWVRGHEGYVPNEQADRLAVLARRNREMKLTEQQASFLVERAHDDILGGRKAA